MRDNLSIAYSKIERKFDFLEIVENIMEWILDEKTKLHYRLDAENMIVTEAEYTDSKLEIPKEKEGKTVTGIGKKAFFGCQIRTIVLPSGITDIEDWAFAGCRRLEEIWLPDGIEHLGKEIFLKDSNLKRIIIYRREEKNLTDSLLEYDEAAAVLLAHAVTKMKSYALFFPLELGSRSWYETWDEICEQFLSEPDDTGFSPILAGGEEDYITNENDVSYYCHMRRMEKAELAYERLRYPAFLAEEKKEMYRKYLRCHNYGDQSGETWEFLKQSGQKQSEYMEVFADSGCVTLENKDALIRDLKENDTELKAFLLRFRSGENEDIFTKLLNEVDGL